MIDTDALHRAGFRDPAHYIEAITYAIWNLPERDPELIRRWYSPDCVIHTDWGDLRDVDAVITNTTARLIGYPDFAGRIDDTIWTVRDDGTLQTSMRWRWTGTDTGGTAFGPATGRVVEHLAIADCVVDGTVITREWLGSDMLGLARQLGLDPAQARVILSATRSEADPVRFRRERDDDADAFTPSGPAGEVVVRLLDGLFSGAPVEELITADCRTAVAGDQTGVGPGVVRDWLEDLALAGAPELIMHDQYAAPTDPDGIDRVASRAELRLGADLGSVNLIAHHHVRDDSVTAQWLLADRLAARPLT